MFKISIMFSIPGGTPTGARVSAILNAHVDRLDAAKGKPEYAQIKPLDLIVITDGVPCTCMHHFTTFHDLNLCPISTADPPASELKQELIKVALRIKGGPHHPNSMGVQFVQIGTDPATAVNLPLLLNADTGVSPLSILLGNF